MNSYEKSEEKQNSIEKKPENEPRGFEPRTETKIHKSNLERQTSNEFQTKN